MTPRPMTKPHAALRARAENDAALRVLLAEREALLRDIKLSLDNPGSYDTEGSWRREIHKCCGCGREAEGWGSYNKIQHAEGCATVAGHAAERRLRAALKREGLE